MAGDHERYENDAGAYLLGALPPLEAEVFERHLMRCDECRDEVARLRPAVEALPRAVEQVEPPAGLKRSLMGVVEAEAAARAEPEPARERAERRRPPLGERLRDSLAGLRPRTALALAGVALLAGLALGIGLTSGADDSRTVQASVDASRLTGSARVEVDGDAATLRVEGMPLPPPGRVYEVWVDRGGDVRPAGALFSVGSDGRGAAAIPGGVDGVDAVYVTRERAGGVSMPSERPVITART